MHNILKWLQFRKYAISHKLLVKMGRRLRAGPRLLEPVVVVRILPPQYREQGTGDRTVTSNQEPSSKNQTNLEPGIWNLPL